MSDSDMSGQPDVARLTDSIGIGVLTRLIPRDVVDEVLVEAGRLEKRKRLLPARVVVYYVMALCLFFDDAYEEVMRKLTNGLQFLRSWDREWVVPTAGALCQARKRLGELPLQLLFERVAVPIVERGDERGWFRSWRVMALDGVMLDTPDTPANAEEFGRMGTSTGENVFPQVRIAALLECGSRAVIAAQMGGCHTGERELADELLGHLDEDMLLLADRGFYGYEFWKRVRSSDAQLLWRIKTSIGLPVHETLPDGSYRSTLLPASVRNDVTKGKFRNVERYEIPIRVIEYTVTNRGPQSTGKPETIRLITSILDHELAPAAELAALYHQRWDIELAFGEIQIRQMSRRSVLRSKSPEMIRQEIWAMLLTHYAVRHLIHEAARDDPDTNPDQISFTRSLRVIRRQVTDQAAFSPHTTRRRNPDDTH